MLTDGSTLSGSPSYRLVYAVGAASVVWHVSTYLQAVASLGGVSLAPPCALGWQSPSVRTRNGLVQLVLGRRRFAD
jgi:hypothetical protein